MDYFLTEEQLMIQDLARQIAEEKVLPVRAELDEKEEFPRELMKHFAGADLCGLNIPDEFGGMGLGGLDQALAVERWRADAGVGGLHLRRSGLGALFPSDARLG